MSGVRFGIFTLAVVGLATAAAGCGSRSIVPVKGVVTFDGKPLAKASVVFSSQERGGRDASGFTDTDGVFELTTFRPKDGALPGLYKVTVHYSEAVAVPVGPQSPADAQRAAVTVKPSSVVIAPIYSQPDRTVLSQKVPPDGAVRIELKSQP